MTTCVRVLSSSSVDSSPSILLVASDGTKILVNCGEGCQRCFLEYGQRLATVSTVLLCDTDPQAIGGLPGMILTSADASAVIEASAVLQRKSSGDSSLNSSGTNAETTTSGLQIIGPTGTKQYIHSLRHFMRRDKFLVTVHEGSTDVPLQVFLSRGRNRAPAKKAKQGKTPEPEEVGFTIQSLAISMNDVVSHVQPQANDTRKHPRDEVNEGDTTTSATSPQKRRHQALSFIIQTPPIQGKFLAQKAMELRVPKGPLYAKLKAGHSVSFTDENTQTERTVHSIEVVSPPSPAVVVLILYYPNTTVATRLFDSKELIAAVDSTSNVVELVFHIAPKELLQAHGLPFWKKRGVVEQVWMSTLCTEETDSTTFLSARQGAKARSLLCPDLYICSRPDRAIQVSPSHSTIEFRIGRATMEYTLIPRAKRGFNETTLTLTDMGKIDQEASQLVETIGAKAAAQKIIDEIVPSTNADPTGELFFTGTGSAVPCKHRNVTGMLLKQADGRSILLDVGEGTIGQLLRAETTLSPEVLLADIKAVWISHPHADHHLGLLKLLTDRVSDDCVLLLAPTPIFRFLDEYAEIDPSIRGTYYAIDSSLLIEPGNTSVQDKIRHALGISSCRSVPVAHCAHAYAVILDGTSFGRVVYSGDCRPSTQLAHAAIGADLLIHEATFEDGMEAEAALKKHSTVGEALAISQAMQCRCTVLTHFSQRYPKIPPTPTVEYTFPIIFAFDFMRLRTHNLLLAAKMTPALRLLYPETDGDDKESFGSSVASKVLSIPGVFGVSKLL